MDIIEIIGILLGIGVVTYPASLLVERILRYWEKRHP